MSFDRNYDLFDRALLSLDNALRLLGGGQLEHPRPSPAKDMAEPPLNEQDKSLSGALMRINHTGEVCAQALYQGQALTSRSAHLRVSLKQAQAEEVDHLVWCSDRLLKLGSRPSWLNPVCYVGSLSMGALAGVLGDGWNLGFLAETERQVEAHLHEHMQRLPASDLPSHAVLSQMRIDEGEHADMAMQHGAKSLPVWVRKSMQWTAIAMKSVVFYI